MESQIPHLRAPQGVGVSDLLTAALLPLAVILADTDMLIRIVTGCLAISSLMVYFLDYRTSVPSPPFTYVGFAPAWLCIAFLPEAETPSRFRLYLAFWTELMYRPLFNKLICTFKKSFTFGEGSLIVQGFLLLAFKSILRLSRQESLRSLHLAKQVAAWLNELQAHIANPTATLLILSWCLLAAVSVLVVVVYYRLGWPVNTRTRKIFHLSVIGVYIPGLLYDPVLLYIASVAASLSFILLELIRWSERLKFVTGSLTTYLKHFTDEKEGGSLILTNIYLLVGVSLPLWVYPTQLPHPVPLSIYSGIIAVGVGDAACSIVGTLLGRTTWRQSSKTLEGALGGLIAQLLSGAAIGHLAQIEFNVAAFAAVCLVTSCFELMVDQVDNLTLPLIMFIGLTLVGS